MLTDEERMNNAFKEMLFHEETMAKKYAQAAQQITDPKFRQMFQGMEQAARNHYSTLAAKMQSFAIV